MFELKLSAAQLSSLLSRSISQCRTRTARFIGRAATTKHSDAHGDAEADGELSS